MNFENASFNINEKVLESLIEKVSFAVFLSFVCTEYCASKIFFFLKFE
mgnify:CR=1 FL=1